VLSFSIFIFCILYFIFYIYIYFYIFLYIYIFVFLWGYLRGVTPPFVSCCLVLFSLSTHREYFGLLSYIFCYFGLLSYIFCFFWFGFCICCGCMCVCVAFFMGCFQVNGNMEVAFDLPRISIFPSFNYAIWWGDFVWGVKWRTTV
jgi:hypothetical protein